MTIEFDVSNVFFPADININSIYTTIRKNIDIFKMIRKVNNHETEEGIGLISLDEAEVQSIIDRINTSKDYIIMGEDTVTFVGTTLSVDALIIEKI